MECLASRMLDRIVVLMRKYASRLVAIVPHNSERHNIRVITKVILITLFCICFFSACDPYLLIYPTSSVIVDNQSTRTVYSVCITSQDSNFWGDNIISTQISPGDALTIASISKSVVKLRIDFLDQSTLFKEMINLMDCEIYIIVVTDAGG